MVQISGGSAVEHDGGVSVGIARIFHAYGENIYLKPDRSQVIASLIYRTIRNSGEDLVVWGDGTQKRCFVFIDDVLEALERIEKYANQKENLTVNLGSQEEISVKALAEQIIQISGKRSGCALIHPNRQEP